MKTVKIFEPAMCCPTGLCGVAVDPELLRISGAIHALQKQGVDIQRFNLTSAPLEFVNHGPVQDFLQKNGPEKLPVVLIKDQIVLFGRYPSNKELLQWLELPEEILFDIQSTKKGYKKVSTIKPVLSLRSDREGKAQAEREKN